MTVHPGELLRTLTDAGCIQVVYVPCSTLAPLINQAERHPSVQTTLANNEGEAVAIATGLTLSGARVCVMLQNSGLGNTVNPLTSLATLVDAPLILVIGYRGKPGTVDEPQHRLMGSATVPMLAAMGIESIVLDCEVTESDLALVTFAGAGITAVLVGGGALEPILAEQTRYAAAHLDRDEAIATVCATCGDNDVIIGSTGYIGRSLSDAVAGLRPSFSMVGSMGCASSLSLGIAAIATDRKVVVLDGDGALLMRLEAMATIGARRPANLVHIVLNNGCHASTGAQGSYGLDVDIPAIALACRYRHAESVTTTDTLRTALTAALHADGPHLVEVRIAESTAVPPRPAMGPAQEWAKLRKELCPDVDS
ncbi:phosphonopyruvate decarboxylase [Nocardia sp. BMG51109]|uniref:phosphonopyruvate decarboxylase n=1 Tax=Nocardia sp. BMG51109 TaxID=1056816 RepID=UPI000464B32E|nr:phosphonopyruvate decarboxylase [Nocardia sp. BMG51109]